MPQGSKFCTPRGTAAATGTPLADITDVNTLPTYGPNNKRQKLDRDRDTDFVLEPTLQAAAGGTVYRPDGLAGAVIGPDPDLTDGAPPAIVGGAIDDLLDEQHEAMDAKDYEEAVRDLKEHDARMAARNKEAKDVGDDDAKSPERKVCVLDINGKQVRMSKLTAGFYATKFTQAGATSSVTGWFFRTAIDMNPYDDLFKCIVHGYIELSKKINSLGRKSHEGRSL